MFPSWDIQFSVFLAISQILKSGMPGWVKIEQGALYENSGSAKGFFKNFVQ